MNAHSYLNLRPVLVVFNPAILPGQASQAPSSPQLTCVGASPDVIANRSYQCTIQWSTPAPATVTLSEVNSCASLPGTVTLTNGTSGKFDIDFESPSDYKSCASATIQATANGQPAVTLKTFTVTASGQYTGGEIFRLVAGGEEAFAPNIQPAGKLFADMFLDWGLIKSGDKSDNPTQGRSWGSPLRYWLQAGAQSTTQAATGQTALAIYAGNAPTGLSSRSVEEFALRTG